GIVVEVRIGDDSGSGGVLEVHAVEVGPQPGPGAGHVDIVDVEIRDRIEQARARVEVRDAKSAGIFNVEARHLVVAGERDGGSVGVHVSDDGEGAGREAGQGEGSLQGGELVLDAVSQEPLEVVERDALVHIGRGAVAAADEDDVDVAGRGRGQV